MLPSKESPTRVVWNEQHVIEWMGNFQKAVGTRDLAVGRRLFDAEVVSFGTVAGRVGCLDELVEKQWAHRWPRNEDFRFEMDSAKIISGGADTWIVVVSWSTLDDGLADSRRHGRPTLVLRAHAGVLLCIHSHFSLVP